MASCERCWHEAGRSAEYSFESKVDIYSRLIDENSCTLEEQAGLDADMCETCKRRTIHQIANYCLSCGTKKGPTDANSYSKEESEA